MEMSQNERRGSRDELLSGRDSSCCVRQDALSSWGGYLGPHPGWYLAGPAFQT